MDPGNTHSQANQIGCIGERLVPISGREAMNTIVWQCRFESLYAAEAALKQMDSSTERTELARRQHPMFNRAGSSVTTCSTTDAFDGP